MNTNVHQPRRHAPQRHTPRFAILALILAAGVAAPAAAQNWHWNTTDGTWTNASNWVPLLPPQPSSNVFIGSTAAAANSLVTLDFPSTVATLSITDGMTLRTFGRSLHVGGNAVVSGVNSIPAGGGQQIDVPSTLLVSPVDGLSLFANNLTLSDGAILHLVGQSYIQVDGTLTNGASCRVGGGGVITVQGAGTALVNNGRVQPREEPELRIRNFTGGRYDLDGTSGDGEMWMTSQGGARLRFDGVGLTDTFGGSVLMNMNGADLFMNLTEGWTADQSSLITIDNSGAAQVPAIIRGGPMTFGGLMNIEGPTGHVEVVPAGLVLQAAARLHLGDGARADIGADVGTQTTIDGGQYTLGQDAILSFHGPTTVRGGEFSSFGTSIYDGRVEFHGPTTWNGGVEFNGACRQLGSATVTGVTVINAGTFDMDGAGATTWNLNHNLTVNAQSVVTGDGDTSFGGTFNISGALLSRLTVNLANPLATWIMSGQMNLTGDPALFATRIAGSAVSVAGTLTLPSGRAVISSNLLFSAGGTLNLPSASSTLRLTARSQMVNSFTFNGIGTVQLSPTAEMILWGGCSLNQVGLVNYGRLRLSADSAGIASVDRFQNIADGTLQISLGGYLPGSRHDQLIVSGGQASLAGRLEVNLFDDGDGLFVPAIGDEFTVLTAVGGVTGVFDADPVSISGGQRYEWSVIYNTNSVAIRLESIEPAGPPPCIADFNEDGGIDGADVEAFFAAWELGWASADVNMDGGIDGADVEAFFGRWEAGLC